MASWDPNHRQQAPASPTPLKTRSSSFLHHQTNQARHRIGIEFSLWYYKGAWRKCWWNRKRKRLLEFTIRLWTSNNTSQDERCYSNLFPCSSGARILRYQTGPPLEPKIRWVLFILRPCFAELPDSLKPVITDLRKAEAPANAIPRQGDPRQIIYHSRWSHHWSSDHRSEMLRPLRKPEGRNWPIKEEIIW